MSSSDSSSAADRDLNLVRVELLGRLVRRYGHRINNLLTRLGGQIALAERSVEDPQKIQSRLTKLQSALDHTSQAVRSLQLCARGSQETEHHLVLDGFDDELLDLFRDANQPALQFHREGSDEEWMGPIRTKGGQLRFTLFALAHSFAIEAVRGRPIRIGLAKDASGDTCFRLRAPVEGDAPAADSYLALAQEIAKEHDWGLKDTRDPAERRCLLGPFVVAH